MLVTADDHSVRAGHADGALLEKTVVVGNKVEIRVNDGRFTWCWRWDVWLLSLVYVSAKCALTRNIALQGGGSVTTARLHTYRRCIFCSNT